MPLDSSGEEVDLEPFATSSSVLAKQLLSMLEARARATEEAELKAAEEARQKALEDEPTS